MKHFAGRIVLLLKGRQVCKPGSAGILAIFGLFIGADVYPAALRLCDLR
jgi:hypothetical protein